MSTPHWAGAPGEDGEDDDDDEGGEKAPKEALEDDDDDADDAKDAEDDDDNIPCRLSRAASSRACSSLPFCPDIRVYSKLTRLPVVLK